VAIYLIIAHGFFAGAGLHHDHLHHRAARRLVGTDQGFSRLQPLPVPREARDGHVLALLVCAVATEIVFTKSRGGQVTLGAVLGAYFVVWAQYIRFQGAWE
jgi:hypothetical protein